MNDKKEKSVQKRIDNFKQKHLSLATITYKKNEPTDIKSLIGSPPSIDTNLDKKKKENSSGPKDGEKKIEEKKKKKNNNKIEEVNIINPLYKKFKRKKKTFKKTHRKSKSIDIGSPENDHFLSSSPPSDTPKKAVSNQDVYGPNVLKDIVKDMDGSHLKNKLRLFTSGNMPNLKSKNFLNKKIIYEKQKQKQAKNFNHHKPNINSTKN